MDTLPETVTEYRRTRIFTNEDVPAALTRAHDTKPGVWGRLEVLRGSLRYHVLEGDHVGTYTINKGEAGVITPAVKHRVEPTGPASFQVVFLR